MQTLDARSCFLFSLVLAFALTTLGQTAAPVDNTDLQSWNEIQLTVGLNKWTDLNASAALWFGKNISRFQEEKVTLGVTFKPARNFSFSPSLAQLQVRSFAGRIQPEYRIYLRGVYKFPFKRFGLSHRSQYEYRIRTTRNTWRFAPSLTVEKELPKSFASGLKLFLTEEPFYDSASKRFSRNRLSFGFNKVLTKKLSVDIYYLRQDDSFSHPNLIHVIGTTWKVKL